MKITQLTVDITKIDNVPVALVVININEDFYGFNHKYRAIVPATNSGGVELSDIERLIDNMMMSKK
jgi:hypothetical protein